MGFWNTTSGVVTGVAGTLTGVVGIATLAAQMGWVGSGGDGDGGAPPTGRAGAEVAEDTDNRLGEPGAAGADRTPGTTGEGAGAEPTFTVAPATVRFAALGSRTATVTVRNTGSAEVSVDDVVVDGEDEGRFTVAAAPCTASTLAPGRSCEVEVSYAPEGSGTARATMVVEVDGAPAQEVPLTAAALL